MFRCADMLHPLWLACALAAAGCDGVAPEVVPLTDERVAVGHELRVLLVASDADGDKLQFAFHTRAPSANENAVLGLLPVGAAEFRWRPDVRDVGVWPIGFEISDGTHSVFETIQVDVRATQDGEAQPVFVRPQGTGRVFRDFALGATLRVSVAVEDRGSRSVALSQETPLEGSELELVSGSDGTEATFSWRPGRDDIESLEPVTLVFRATDGQQSVAEHRFSLFFRQSEEERHAE